ncbi:helix-turn-helix domain-containing protein [Saccharopolyspora sp. K220]|uniref:helix-turn-helix domain-containing protein n=1 Tax=Saccharopolyspora soli TaxID=2926618 RepID=UPI001F582CA3|nr:helix-turn-helix transcriptional regulator [Saccharopolyspora soli]MCI2422145.1 helix-turn-helix domain-containing protein [Saccharopolyspora soli]
MVDQLALDVGERVRFHRLAAKKTQNVVAGLAGITTDYLYQIERGKKLPTVPVLVAIADALDVPPASLINTQSQEVVPRQSRAAGEELHRAMTLRPAAEGEPLPLADLRNQINEAWRLWQSSPTRYSQVSGLLGNLIVEVERSLHTADATGTGCEAHRAAADLYGLTRTVAKRTGRVDLALLAADRGLRAAEVSDDSLRVGAARWNLAHVALAERHHEVAEDIAMNAAHELRDHSGPDAAAVYGSLILVAGVAAARRRDMWTARDRVRSVMPVAWKTGECNTLWTAFGPTNVAMHAVSIEVEAGETSQACHLAEEIEHERSPSIERRVAFLLEQARSYQQRKDYGSALVLLNSAEREAPEDVAYRPLAHSILREVVQRAGRTTAKEAARLAEKLSVPVS